MRTRFRESSLLAVAFATGCATASPSGRAADEPERKRGERSLLCVVRHAEAYKNLEPSPPDLTPEQLDSLTAVGIAQTEQLRRALPRGVSRVLSSPTGRTRQTAQGLGVPAAVEVAPELSSLRGGVPLAARKEAWAQGLDPRPAGGESLADGAARATQLIDRLRQELPAGGHAVVVTHGDLAPVLIGELAGTPLLQRPARHPLATGQMQCLALGEADLRAPSALRQPPP